MRIALLLPEANTGADEHLALHGSRRLAPSSPSEDRGPFFSRGTAPLYHERVMSGISVGKSSAFLVGERGQRYRWSERGVFTGRPSARRDLTVLAMSAGWVIVFTLATACASRAPRVVSSPVEPEQSKVFTGDPSIFERPEREEELDLERTMDAIGIREGSVVADVGAGGGWLTVRLARRVGPSGLVHAIDVQDAMLERVRERAAREGLFNVRFVLAPEDGPTLPQSSIDCIVVLKTYHEVSDPLSLLRNLRSAMRPDGRLAVIDSDNAELRERARRRAIDPKVPRQDTEHAIARDTVIVEANQARLSLTLERELPGEDNYLLVFFPVEIRPAQP